ncbi:AAA family ATPase [Pseudoclavibacter sp. Z016]|uniref:AAA family ATPase n=1 Tax=Pseudoclavibacter sp. Z016 TaxID=2080581 RepID=UPI000CE92B87|nr:AAA family ATPase [Pseudoclavibacter sp. Z016]PPF73421.1 AAA family ATPase [Pseudoclavibacter sp. Z016]
MSAPAGSPESAPRRVLIAGAAGVGKTAVARQVERNANLPHTEIDALFHGPGWTVQRGFLESVDAFTSEERWVTEWQYATQLGDLLTSRADTLVFLDYSVWTHMSRLVRRTLRRRLRRVELWNGNIEPPLHTILVDPEHIVRWGWKGRAKIRRRVDAAERARPNLRVIRLRSQAEADDWLRSLRPHR